MTAAPTRLKEAVGHLTTRATEAVNARLLTSRVANSKVVAKAATAAYARSMAMPLERPDHRCVPGEVVGIVQIAPYLHRLTVRVDLGAWAPLGPDEYVGLVMPQPGTTLPDLSTVTGPNPRPVIGELPDEERPEVRWYTVRDYRPAEHELDLEIILHPVGEVEEGPGARWVRGVRPGDQVAIQTGTAAYHPPADATVQLLVGDETAYPALVGIIESARDTEAELHVVLEISEEGAVPSLPEPARGSLTVVLRRGQDPGQAALEAAMATADTLPRLDYGWACGEQTLATSVRRHLIAERGVAKTSVYFCAYWILGRARG